MRIKTRELTVFAMLGALLYASKVIMEIAPNIHLICVFIIAFTRVYRGKALYPLYVFVFITGLLNGFNTWWIPYLYIWTVLWGIAMLLPKKMPPKIEPAIYMIVCALHGFLYGTLYAPAQAIIFGLDFEGMIAWIIAGLPFDIIHGISNFICGILIVPIIKILKKLENNSIKN